VTVAGLLAVASASVVSISLLLVVVTLVWWIDRHDREPSGLVVFAFLWGAAVAPVACYSLLRYGAAWIPDGSADAAAAIWLVLLEVVSSEVLKGLAVVSIVVFAATIDNPTDGIVYGAASGLGYAMTHNALNGPGTVWGLTVVDGAVPTTLGMLMAACVHAAAGIAVGGCVGMTSLSRGIGARLSWMMAGLAIAVSVHGGWHLMEIRRITEGAGNGPLLLSGAALAVVTWALLFGLFRCENRILDRQLSEEVDLGTVPSWVVDVIPYYRRRVTSSWWPDRRERTVLARLLARLAFRKQAVRGLPEEEGRLAGLEVVQLRNRIKKMLEPVGGDREGLSR
jgi:RsiW-degrading membrane proteinase PrsW (M82 family)